ncbi:protein RRP6-like 2 isoform X2 [Abrus precatorius]|uniref:Protein RRP6-like 2 isoform X2 n=1 Tax=Abrus precatorius TaxID=3816 RepID=A0A8B8LUF3_ABRPR|nr:protein RRP6-like 2 isoform X2 [Abrus precatorius]
MDVDHDQPHTAANAQALQTLTAGPLSSSVAKLAASSRCIPSDKDFHFYRNFEEFKVPVEEIARESRSMLEAIGVAAAAHGAFPVDVDDAYDWLVNVNDDILERFDASADEFRKVRQQEEETGRPAKHLMEEDGFQLVSGRKKKGGRGSVTATVTTDSETKTGSALAMPGVTVATKDKKTTGPRPKVPFHIPTIPRPQDEYSIVVNNANMPFEHVWLQRSDDGLRFIHPLEKLSVLDFVDTNVGDVVPMKPPSIESTPFKLVEEVKDLKELAAKLRSVNEFAVDLEHNQYRSFQGLTCLMQISTRTEDFVVDTLKLRIHVGPYLREVFKDPAKRKVMHGADRDIVWLQRDFGIYVCNLFDTHQASKLLNLERNSLEYILHHFCEVTANKEYQNADWRLRPLPDEMLRYAREDTHYLLYIYDLMRTKLFALSKDSENSKSSDTPLVEVYKRSYDVCMQLYEKELLTENSYVHIYGLQGADFNAHQLAIVSGLCEWRDIVARAEDESTGYVLPNKSLLEIAKQMPLTTSKLRRLVKSKHPYVEHNLDTVVNIIRHSIQNAAAFEEDAQQLKGQAYAASNVVLITDGTEDTQSRTQNLKESSQHQDTNVPIQIKSNSLTSELPRDSLAISEQSKDANGNGATVQLLKKPSGAFGALLGNSASKRKLGPDKGKEEMKLEQIRSSVSLPFHSFLGSNEKSEPLVKTPSVASETSEPPKLVFDPVSASTLDEIIKLDSNTGAEDTEQNNLENSNDGHREKSYVVSTSGKEDEDEPVSLSELSSNFQKCFHSNDQSNKTRQPKKTEQPSGILQLKPFDYEAARKHVKFGEDKTHASSQSCDGHMEMEDSGSKKQRSTIGQGPASDLTKQLPQGRRRQAFPASGNRSSTFR